MPTKTIRDYAGANVSGDLGPLFDNTTFTAAANAELASIAIAEELAARAATVDENYRGTVNLFGSACASLRAIAKKFPETGKFIDEAIKHTQLSMQVIVNNPVAAKPATPAGQPWRGRWNQPTAPAPTPAPATTK